MTELTLGALRTIIEQIGKGHDDKPITVLMNRSEITGTVISIDAGDVSVQGDRILFGQALNTHDD